MHLRHVLSTSIRYLSLEHLIAPFLIKIIYWIGLIAILSAGLGTLFTGSDSAPFGVPLTIIAMFITLLLWRLFCELLILAFNIYIRLTEIRDLLAVRQARVDARKPISITSLKGPRLNPLSKVQHD